MKVKLYAIISGTHLLCVEIWGPNAGPFLLLLNFVSVSGFTVAPLLVKPFLYEPHITFNNNTTRNETNFKNETDINIGADDGQYVIYITYLIVGIYGFVIALIFLFIIISDRRNKKHPGLDALSIGDDHNDDVTSKDKVTSGFSKCELHLIYILYFWMILFYGGIEVAFPGQITTFVNQHLHWPKSTGASLASVNMGSNTAFTFLGILISMVVPPLILIWIDVIALFVSLLIMTLLVGSYPWTLWLCSSLVGISSATIMPSAYTLANDMFEITWMFNSAFWCGFFSGFMLSNLTGFLMHKLGYMWYCYTLLLCSFLVLIMFALMSLIIIKQKSRQTLFYKRHTEDLKIVLRSCKRCFRLSE